MLMIIWNSWIKLIIATNKAKHNYWYKCFGCRCYEGNENKRLYGHTFSDDVEDEVVMFEYNINFTAPVTHW